MSKHPTSYERVLMNMSEVNTSMCFVAKEPPLCKNNSDDFTEGIIAVFF